MNFSVKPKQRVAVALPAVSLLVALCSLLFAVSAPAQPASERAAGTASVIAPRLRFAETNFNFGTLMPTDRAKHEFVFTNTGNAALVITGVHSSCGCTTADEGERKIEPGQTGRIPVLFNPERFNGTVRKTVAVISNDPEQGTQTLSIEATVVRPLEVKPPFVTFLPLRGEERAETKVVRIVSNLEEDVKLDAPVSSDPVFTTELKTLRPGREFELHVTWTGSLSEATAAGSILGNITIKTSATHVPLLTISAAVRPQAAVSIMPQLVRLPGSPLGADFWQAVVIRNNSTTPMRLSDAAINLPGATVNIIETTPGKAFTVRIDFPSEVQISPNDQIAVTIKSSHPAYSTIRVPVIQWPARAAAAPAGSQ